MKHKIEIPIPINIFGVALSMGFCGPIWSKFDAERIHRSGIKSIRGQDSHCRYSSVFGVDRVWENAGFDVNTDLSCLEFKRADVASCYPIPITVDRAGLATLIRSERGSG